MTHQNSPSSYPQCLSAPKTAASQTDHLPAPMPAGAPAASTSPQSSALASVVVRPASRRAPVNLITALEFDHTESSLAFREGIQRAVETFSNEFSQRVADITAYVASHGDLDYGEKPILHLDGGTIDQAVQACRSIDFAGGGDLEETHLDGIDFLLQRVPWAQDLYSRNVLVAFLNGDTKPAHCGKSPRQLGQELRDLGVMLFLVCEPTPTLQNLADAARGIVIPISNDPDLGELQRATAQLCKSLTASLTQGATMPMTL